MCLMGQARYETTLDDASRHDHLGRNPRLDASAVTLCQLRRYLHDSRAQLGVGPATARAHTYTQDFAMAARRVREVRFSRRPTARNWALVGRGSDRPSEEVLRSPHLARSGIDRQQAKSRWLRPGEYAKIYAITSSDAVPGGGRSDIRRHVALLFPGGSCLHGMDSKKGHSTETSTKPLLRILRI